MKEYVAAVDLGTTKVVVIVGERERGGVKVVAYKEAPSKGVLRGEVVNIQSVLDSLTPLIEEIERENELTLREVFVGIAGQNIESLSQKLSRNRSLPSELISKEEVAEMLKEMANTRVNVGEKILHVIPQSYNVDDHIGVECASGMRGSRIEGDYKLFIGKITSAEHSKDVIERAGLKLKELILEPVASAKAVIGEEEMEMGVAMVDIGGGSTDLLIYHDNKIRESSVISFGGNSITEDIRQGCRVSQRYAEQIKIQYGSCFSDFVPDNQVVAIPATDSYESREISLKLLSNIIEARMEEIIEAVLYKIENSGYGDKLGAGIVLTGGGSKLTNIEKLFKYHSGLSVRLALPNGKLINGANHPIDSPTSSTAIGLLMIGLEIIESEKEEQKKGSTTLFDEEELATSEVAQEREKVSNKRVARSPKRSGNKLISLVGNIFDSSNNDA